MIDSAHLKRLLLGAAALLLVGAAVAAVLGAYAFSGGLALGFLLGAVPFASWTWILPRILGGGRGRALALALLIVKLALYAGALYLGVARKLADPVGVFAGMTVVAAVLIVGVLWKGTAPAKEVS